MMGLTSSRLTWNCHIMRRTAKFATKLAERSLGGEVCALSDMIDHTSLSRDFYAPPEGLGLDMVGLEDCESLSAYLKTTKTIAEM